MSSPTRGLFFALEGGEGSGKSSTAQRLAIKLGAQGYDCELTFHPGNTGLGQKIRSLLLHRQEFQLDPREELQLFAIDFNVSLKRIILPAIERGAIVISDRFTPSTLAYQGAAGQLDTNFVQDRLDFWTEGVVPVRIYLIDIDPEIGLRRGTGGGDKIEARTLDFHRAVRQSYLAQAAAAPERFRIIDGTLAADEVVRIILSDMSELIEKRGIRHAAVS